mgnify:CR=1 FL=1
MIEQDLGKDVKNPDKSSITLATMRDMLFRQGSAEITRTEDGLVVSFLHPYRLKQTNILKNWFYKISQRHKNGLSILGGQKLTFKLLAPHGEEFRNSGEKAEFILAKILYIFKEPLRNTFENPLLMITAIIIWLVLSIIFDKGGKNEPTSIKAAAVVASTL